MIDPAAPGPKPSLNLVGYTERSERPFAAAAALSVLRKTFDASWGPRTEHVVRNSLLALLDTPRSTLRGVLRLVGDERFRETTLRHVRDPLVRTFWEQEFAALPPAFRAEVIAPVQNKVGALLSNPIIRAHVDQPKAMLSFRDLMDRERLVVANLSKGRIGEDASGFLGSLILGAFQVAAYSRATVPPGQRAPFTLYVDEFPRFVTPSFAELLAESRKFGMGLVLANQNLAQLDPSLRGALLGNAGTLIVFRLSADDALELDPEFAPELRAHDLARLGRHDIALKLAVDGVTSDPFTATVAATPSHPLHEPTGPQERKCSVFRSAKSTVIV
ncbi:MAG: type IV secretory system conjugative DNA transfer family protein [Sandaracinaceae bacterium]|nr:type IV secretory system conjugative DNA transfer family protein [Sandaracinaceae bacterium]